MPLCRLPICRYSLTIDEAHKIVENGATNDLSWLFTHLHYWPGWSWGELSQSSFPCNDPFTGMSACIGNVYNAEWLSSNWRWPALNNGPYYEKSDTWHPRQKALKVKLFDACMMNEINEWKRVEIILFIHLLEYPIPLSVLLLLLCPPFKGPLDTWGSPLGPFGVPLGRFPYFHPVGWSVGWHHH